MHADYRNNLNSILRQFSGLKIYKHFYFSWRFFKFVNSLHGWWVYILGGDHPIWVVTTLLVELALLGVGLVYPKKNAQLPKRTVTNHKKNVTVYCCHTNNTIELATCGLGVSCAGNCSALGATLCPSGNCTGDCAYSFEEEETINTEAESGLSVATQPSWAFKWCSARCNVWKTKGCCYNPVCRDKTSAHKKRCSWFNYLTGNVW